MAVMNGDNLPEGVRRIASRANQRLREWASLKNVAERNALGLTLAEGVRLVAEGLAPLPPGGYRPAALFYADAASERPELPGFLAQARTAGIDCYSLSDDCFSKLSGLGGTEGIALLMRLPPASRVFPLALTDPGACWLLAAGVQDPGNAGALARTALAAGADGCLFLDGADPSSPKFLRGSMGAAFHLPCPQLPQAVFLHHWCEMSTPPRLLAATPSAAANPLSHNFRQVDYHPPLVIMVGGESGLTSELLVLASEELHIPLRAGVESLNLAVAAGIILFEAERSWSGETGNPLS
ncbi:MAG: RNA methyltransferase [Planctomycetota bacterium]|jgi:TrmH family RNA methyltransferase|nr:RNA methyltransferase [Planctomycetota bacterium]